MSHFEPFESPSSQPHWGWHSSHSQSPHSTLCPQMPMPSASAATKGVVTAGRSGGSTQWLTLILLLKHDSPWEGSQGYRERLVLKSQKREKAVYDLRCCCLSVSWECVLLGQLATLSWFLFVFCFARNWPGVGMPAPAGRVPSSVCSDLESFFWNSHTTNFTSACLVFYFENSLWRDVFLFMCVCVCEHLPCVCRSYGSWWSSLQPCALKSSQAFMFQLPFLC